MQAVLMPRYGAPVVLSLGRVGRPSLDDHEVLIRVHAAGVNPIDWRIRKGSLRWLLPARTPVVLGFDVAGEVVELGRNAARDGWGFGDRVMAYLDRRFGGGYAEYAACGAEAAVRLPQELTYEEGAAVPLAASTAWQALHDIGRIKPGDRVLVNGASGGVGTFAVQMAAARGAEAHGVCSEANASLVRGLGASRVFDYHAEDFTRSGESYDIVLDAVGKSSYWRCRRVLQPDGCYVTTLPSVQAAAFSVATKVTARTCRFVLARPKQRTLRSIAEAISEGRLRPVIDRVLPLSEAAEAHAFSETGRARGKIVLRVRDK